MKRQKKKYRKPSHPFSDERLKEELLLIGEYGLRNNQEVWKARTKISEFRHRARELLGHPERERKEDEFLTKLYHLGILSKNADLESALRIEVRDLLERRLQTIVEKKGLAKSIWQARQMIVHRHIVVETDDELDKVITSPSYLVKRGEKVKIHPQSSFKQEEE